MSRIMQLLSRWGVLCVRLGLLQANGIAVHSYEPQACCLPHITTRLCFRWLYSAGHHSALHYSSSLL